MKARTQNRSGRAIQQQEENGSSRTDFLLIYKVFSFTVLVMGISKSTKYILRSGSVEEGEKGKAGEHEKKDIR